MSEVLISFPYAELYIVRGSEAPILQSEGELVISSSPDTGDAAEQGPPASCIQLAVGKVSWEVKPSSKALKAGEYTWVFSTSEAGIFYSLTLLASASEEDVGIFEAVLENIAVVKYVGCSVKYWVPSWDGTCFQGEAGTPLMASMSCPWHVW